MNLGTGHAAPSVTVIERVAEREGVDPIGLTPPLHDVVDPDALDRLCGGSTNGSVVFSYCGYTVTVTAPGAVSIEDRPYDSTTDAGPVSTASVVSD